MIQISNLEKLGMTGKTKILVVMPHPDDESVFTAGFILKASKVNVKLDLLCMSYGEKSTKKYSVNENNDLGEVRKTELGNACKILGVSSLIIKNYGDGKLENKTEEMYSFLKEVYEKNEYDWVLTL
ncbi:MAG: PIG-L family deacetylase, partial [Ignavibacteriae bacterium]|nr:PIG-L family deacetylase [Ignavibacteriota bacterium]